MLNIQDLTWNATRGLADTAAYRNALQNAYKTAVIHTASHPQFMDAIRPDALVMERFICNTVSRSLYRLASENQT